MSGKINIINVSGGVDSTACYLLALEQGIPFRAVFADTGNEHEYTLEYINNLARLSGGPEVQTVRADLRQKIAVRRAGLEQMHDSGEYLRDWTAEAVERVLEHLHATGIPFLDLCALKGRFPSTKARFCTIELKLEPIRWQSTAPAISEAYASGLRPSDVWNWVGIRRDESEDRSEAEEQESDSTGNMIYRPLVDWPKSACFDLLKRHNVPPNPLYKLGCGRVGCMFCVNATKDEICEASKRFPHHIDRIREWEQHVRLCSKRGASTFFPATKIPGQADTRADIDSVVEWSKTGHGGMQYDMIRQQDDVPSCSSLYGLCE